MRIELDDLSRPAIHALLHEHLQSMHELSPPQSVHALDLDQLRRPDITFWSAWEGALLLGCGALKEIDARHGEVKSMRTPEALRRRGAGRVLLAHVIEVARLRRYERLSLETGSMDAFRPAQTLYQGFGFTRCGPFGDYVEDANSVFMTLPLAAGGALISTQALADRLDREVRHPQARDGDSDGGPGRLRLFDATVHLRPNKSGPYAVESGRADYLAGHIPTAAFVDLAGELSDARSGLNFTLPATSQLEAALSAAGLSNGDDCVVYSATSPMWATRLWWMLKGLGFEATVLDGGLARWRAEGRPMATGVERYAPEQFRARAQPRRWADRAEVLGAIGDGQVCTLNALRAAVHAGSDALSYGRKGHIQGSVNLPYAQLIRPDGRFKPVAELRAEFAASGALARSRVICYCGGGIGATMNALALGLIGHPDVAVYDGSLAEWARDPSLPMEIGP